MRVKLTIEITENDYKITCEGEEKYCRILNSAVSFILGMIEYALAVFKQYAPMLLAQAKKMGEELSE